MKYADRTQTQPTEDLEVMKKRVTALEDLLEEHKRRVEELRTREQRYRLLAENTIDAVFLTDMALNLVYVNKSSYSILGYMPQEIIGTQVEGLFSPSEYQKVLDILSEELAKGPLHEGRIFEAALLHKDGHEVAAELIGRITFDPAGEPIGIQGSVRDITERKRSEKALQVSENRYRQAVENSPNPIFAIDRTGRIQAWNRACEFTYQHGREIIGQHYDTLLPDTHMVQLVTSEVDRVFRGDSLSNVEIRFYCRDGSTRITTSRLYPLHSSNGLVELCIFANTDITERKRVESEKAALEEQLHQSQKMEAIGRLAGGVAHDMNNILGAIMGSASVLAMDSDDEALGARDIQNILIACQKGRALIQDLLGFAHKGKFVKEALSLNDSVSRIETLLKHTISKKITIETILDRNLGAVEGDPSQIDNALLNICINAADAMSGHGRMTIVTKNVHRSERPGGLAPGHYAQIEVSDTGAGMDTETQVRAIEPFFTTKPKGKGTGLGLSMVYGVIKNHGGNLRIDSQPGEGTTVTILLPMLEQETSKTSNERPVKKTSTVPTPRDQGILLVDDEAIVLNATSRLLKKMGYPVFPVHGGAEALAAYRDNRDQIHLVILDIIMPEMDGPETFEALKELNPDVRVLLSSGYSKDEKVDQLLKNGAVGFLKKPFDDDELSDALKLAFS